MLANASSKLLLACLQNIRYIERYREWSLQGWWLKNWDFPLLTVDLQHARHNMKTSVTPKFYKAPNKGRGPRWFTLPASDRHLHINVDRLMYRYQYVQTYTRVELSTCSAIHLDVTVWVNFIGNSNLTTRELNLMIDVNWCSGLNVLYIRFTRWTLNNCPCTTVVTSDRCMVLVVTLR
jgi:hypothetical protein